MTNPYFFDALFLLILLVSSSIVVIAIFLPYLRKQMPLMRRRMAGNRMGGN
jgi:hypothetical protein